LVPLLFTHPPSSPLLLYQHTLHITSEIPPLQVQSLRRFTRTGFAPNTKKNNYGGSHDIHSAAVQARAWTPDGTGLSVLTPVDNSRDTSDFVTSCPIVWDISSCRFFVNRKGLSPLHAVRTLNVYGSGRCGREGVQVHIGPHWAESVGRTPPGWGVGRPGVTSGSLQLQHQWSHSLHYPGLLVRVCANINQCLTNKKYENERSGYLYGYG